MRSLDASSPLGMKVFFTLSVVEGLYELTDANGVIEEEFAPEMGVLNGFPFCDMFVKRGPN